MRTLEIQLDRESSLVLAMKLLQNHMDTEEVIETDEFYWNSYGTDEDMPNFWLKKNNLQIEWYNDDPGRAAWSNYDSDSDLAFYVLDEVKASYATHSGRKTSPC